MGRLVVLIILVVVAVWLLRRALGKKEQKPRNAPMQDELVRCAHCGVHLPRAEARQKGEASYCSEEHARLGRR